MKWTEKYGIYSTHVGSFDLTVLWESDGYRVRFDSRAPRDAGTKDLEEAKRYALKLAKGILLHAIADVRAAEKGDVP